MVALVFCKMLYLVVAEREYPNRRRLLGTYLAVSILSSFVWGYVQSVFGWGTFGVGLPAVVVFAIVMESFLMRMLNKELELNRALKMVVLANLAGVVMYILITSQEWLKFW